MNLKKEKNSQKTYYLDNGNECINYNKIDLYNGQPEKNNAILKKEKKSFIQINTNPFNSPKYHQFSQGRNGTMMNCNNNLSCSIHNNLQMNDEYELIKDKSNNFNYEALKQKMRLALLKKNLDDLNNKNKNLEMFINKNKLNNNNLQYNALLAKTDKLLMEQRLKNSYRTQYDISN